MPKAAGALIMQLACRAGCRAAVWQVLGAVQAGGPPGGHQPHGRPGGPPLPSGSLPAPDPCR